MTVPGRFVFDGECGFCTRAVGWLERLDTHHRVDLVPLQRSGAPESVHATREQTLEGVRWMDEHGRTASGAGAVAAAASAALGTGLPTRLYRVGPALLERIYRWVAANRTRLPGRTPACEADPERCR